MSGNKRAWVRIDRYSFADVGREHGLHPAEQSVLRELVLQADWRSWEWKGTLADLAEWTGTGRNTIPKAIRKLEAAGIIRVSEPFKGGIGAIGTVRVDLYPRMVIPERRGWTEDARAASDERAARASRAVLEQHTLGIRANYASSDALDQGNQGLPRKRGDERAEDSAVPRPGMDQIEGVESHDDHLCVCGSPLAGHPFIDHEPQLRKTQQVDNMPVPDGPPAYDDGDLARWDMVDDYIEDEA